MGVPKTSEHIKIYIKLQNPSQEPPVSCKAPNQDLKDINVLCTIKINIERKNLGHGCIKDQINIKIHNPSQVPPASSEAPYQDLNDMAVLCTFKIKIERRNLEDNCIKDH